MDGRCARTKATAWGFVRTIDYWLWGLGNGFTVDPVRCQRIASALAPLASSSGLRFLRLRRGGGR